MVGNGEAPVRRDRLPHDDVAATLMVELVAEFTQRLDHIAAGNTRQVAHTVTSTTSSVMGAGTGSAWALRLSR